MEHKGECTDWSHDGILLNNFIMGWIVTVGGGMAQIMDAQVVVGKS
jgi:hypothetical protein